MLKKGGWFFRCLIVCAILYASYLLLLLSLPYVYFKPGVEFLATKQLIYHIDSWRISFYVHVFASPIVILSGLFQFNRVLIHTYPKVHRFVGKMYIITVLFVSGPSALVMAFYANGGYLSQISFVLLSLCWMLFTWLSFRFARKVDFRRHANWAIRSYALTLSAVTLRFYAYLFDIYNVPLPPRETYILLSYLSWLPNLFIVELLIRFGYPNSLLIKK